MALKFCKEVSRMTVTLSPQLEQYVEQKVATGEYSSVSDVLNAALHQLQHGEQQDEDDIEIVKAALQVADHQFASGQYRTYTSETLQTLADEIKAKGRAQLSAKE